MELTAILALLRAVPSIFSTAQAIRADLSQNDQATLDEALARARASAHSSVVQAEADLQAASKD